jgi:hypothetical protein
MSVFQLPLVSSLAQNKKSISETVTHTSPLPILLAPATTCLENQSPGLLTVSTLLMTSHDKDVASAAPLSGSSVTQTTSPNAASNTEVVIKSFEGFLSFVLSPSIFGASTFAITVSQIANPSDLTANPQFTQESVRTFLCNRNPWSTTTPARRPPKPTKIA